MTRPMRPPPRVLVTGATGLIGRHVVAKLAGQAEVVYAVGRSFEGEMEDATWIACDLTAQRAITPVLESTAPDVVIHLAGLVQGDRTLELVLPTLAVNLVSTVELLEAATRIGTSRIVVSGSLLEEPLGRSHVAIPPSPYGASRWASSAYARMFNALFETPVVILRPSYVYGPGQESTKLIPHVIESLLAGEAPDLSLGDRRMDFVYAEDVADAFVAAAVTNGIEGRTIDIGSGEMTRVRDAVEMIVDLLETHVRPLFGAASTRPFEQEVEVDAEPAARSLGWRATTKLEEGLRRTVAAYVSPRYTTL